MTSKFNSEILKAITLNNELNCRCNYCHTVEPKRKRQVIRCLQCGCTVHIKSTKDKDYGTKR